MLVREVQYIKKYLSEADIKITKGSRTLIDAPTGSGKTTFAIKDRTHKYNIVLLPKIAIGLSKKNEEYPFFYNGKIPSSWQLNNTLKAWYSTYNNILKIPIEVLQESIVYLDEVHLLGTSGYKLELGQIIARVFKYAKTVVGLSGTINKEIFQDYFYEYIPIKRKVNRCITINNVVCSSSVTTVKFALQQILAQIDNGFKVMVLIENHNELKLLVDNLKKLDIFQDESSILKYVSPESRLTLDNHPEAVKVISNGFVSDKTLVVCGTSALVEGWDLETEDNWSCIIAGDSHLTDKIKTPEVAIQFANRTRNLSPVVVNIQRTKVVVVEPELLIESEIENKVNFVRQRDLEIFKTIGKTNSQHIVVFEDGSISFTEIPIIEKRQSNLDKKYSYKRGSYHYYNHAQSLGVVKIIETEFNDFRGEFIPHSSLDDAIINIVEENPHPFNVTEKQVDDYLACIDGVDLPLSIKRLIATCGELEIKAKQHISDVMNLLRCYDAKELKDALEMGISVNQLLTRTRKIISKAVTLYRVRQRLLVKLGTDRFYTAKEIEKVFREIPTTLFLGKSNELLCKGKNIKSLLGGFVSYEESRNSKQRLYRLAEEYYETFTNKKNSIILQVRVDWVNARTRERIENTIQVIKTNTKRSKERRESELRILNKEYANHVEFFEDLTA